MNPLSQKGAWLIEHGINGRDFDPNLSKTNIKAVFLRHAVKAPRKIGLAPVQAADFFHPLPAPYTGVKVGNQTERLMNQNLQGMHKGFPCYHFRVIRFIGIQYIIEPIEQFLLMTVRQPPIDEISALKLCQLRIP